MGLGIAVRAHLVGGELAQSAERYSSETIFMGVQVWFCSSQ